MDFYVGKDKFGSNVIVDFNRRTDDKTNANILIFGKQRTREKLSAEAHLNKFTGGGHADMRP